MLNERNEAKPYDRSEVNQVNQMPNFLGGLVSEMNKAVNEARVQEAQTEKLVQIYAEMGYESLCSHIQEQTARAKKLAFDLDVANRALARKMGV